MKKNKLITLGLITLSTLAFTACGGGSSSSDTIAFPKDAAQAEANNANAKEVTDVVASNPASTTSSLNAVENSSSQNIALTLYKAYQKTPKLPLQNYALNETFSDTEECEKGNIAYSGSGTETGGATLNISYNHCTYSDMTMNGSIEVKYSNYNNTYEGYTVTAYKYTSDYSITTPNFSSTVFKGSTTRIELSDITGSYEANKAKLSLTAISETNGEKSGQEGSIYFFNNQGEMYQIAGKIYINNLTSYVTYDTSYDMSQTPFVFNYNGELTSGEARYLMANGGKVIIGADSNGVHTCLDSNGDGYCQEVN